MREKRGLEGGEDELPERKRPALARYIAYYYYFFFLHFFYERANSISCILIEGFFSYPPPPPSLELNLAGGEKSKHNSVCRLYKICIAL